MKKLASAFPIATFVVAMSFSCFIARAQSNVTDVQER
jgi:hypothetical protein